jgi:hypothetical protein
MGSRGRLGSGVCRWAALLVVLVAGCMQGGRERPATSRSSAAREAAGQGWLELATPHFLVHTDCYRERAIELAQQLEQSRSMLLAVAWPKAREPGGRTHVVIFARPGDFARYSGTTGLLGVSITRAGVERTIAFSPGREGGVPRVVTHELVHDLSQWFFPLQPAWFAEGLAMYLENTRFDAASGRVVMGEASQESLRWMKEVRFFASAQRLFEDRSPHSVDPREVTTFYAGSWFLVTYLMNGEAEAFGRFQKRLHQLMPWRRAWDESFAGMTTTELDDRLVGYAQSGGNISIMSIAHELPVTQPKLRVLSAAEAHGVKADLASALAPELAEDEAQAALALDANELRALSVRFRAADAEPPDSRRAIAGRAVAAHPRAGEAWYLQATAAGDAAALGSALERAVALEPEHPGVALLAAEDALARGDTRHALERVRFALRRSALSPSMLGLYAAALEANGQCAAAASIAASASASFGADCVMRRPDMMEHVGCAAYVQSRIGSPRAPCKPAKPPRGSAAAK